MKNLNFLNFLKKEGNDTSYLEILQYSPAEISVIEMKPGSNQFDIIFINKLKAKQFDIADEGNIIGKKCYSIFEPNQLSPAEDTDHCKNCPSLEAYSLEGKIIHIDWSYYNKAKKEVRFTSLTAQRIPHTTKVIEICRDSTIRKRISDLIIEIGGVKRREDIDEIIFKGFLEQLYFERCRIYEYSESKKKFILKKFKKAKRDENNKLIGYEDIEFNNILNNTFPEQYILSENTKALPKIYVAQNHIKPSYKKKNYVYLKEGEYDNSDIYDKKGYPIWVDIPILSTNKVLGKISIDKRIDVDMSPDLGIEDYDIEIIGLFAQNIGNIIEKLKLLNISKLHEINEIVLKNDKTQIDQNLTQILDKGCDYLGSSNGKIIIDMNENVKIIEILDGQIKPPYTTDYSNTIYNELKEHKTKTHKIFDLNSETHIKEYSDVNHKIGIRYCLLNPIIDENNNLLGTWYQESFDKFDDDIISRTGMLANQTAIAITSIKQYLELQKERDSAKKYQEEAENALKERETFFETAEHEMMAPLDPILHCFEFLGKKLEKSSDSKVRYTIKDGINHCHFLNNTFYNINLLRSNLALNKKPISIFSDIIIPMVETLQDYANCSKMEIVYYGIKNVAEIMMLDEMLIKNVFFNLIRNAVKYSNPGAAILIGGVKVMDGYSYIEVVNYGIGIPLGEEEDIFTVYKRCDNAKIMNPSGMGIGLSIVKRIIDMHSGYIKVTQNSNPTIFELRLPKV